MNENLMDKIIVILILIFSTLLVIDGIFRIIYVGIGFEEIIGNIIFGIIGYCLIWNYILNWDLEN